MGIASPATPVSWITFSRTSTRKGTMPNPLYITTRCAAPLPAAPRTGPGSALSVVSRCATVAPLGGWLPAPAGCAALPLALLRPRALALG